MTSRVHTLNVTFIHGFTQTSASWEPVISLLEDHFDCTSLDAPGHGSNTDSSLSLPECGHFIAHVMPPGVLVGYSMGARMALHAAIQDSTNISALVLISGTPGIEDDAEREQRRVSDNALADRIEDIGVPQFIDEWLANPMFSGLDARNKNGEDRLGNSAQGLANSLRYAGTGTQIPLWDQLDQLTMPVLLIVGENDAKFVNIAQRMNSLLPNSELVIVPHVGHTVHLENTAAFVQILKDFLLRVQRNSQSN